MTVDIPRNKLVVVTGVSGSGKSSLAFDTLYAEGQRRYVESLSSYARQFMGRIQKPNVERIEGIPPAIAIQQKVSNRNPRSTVGTTTEIYDYLKLLYARIGHTISPISHTEVRRHTIRDVVDYMCSLPQQSRVYLLAPIDKDKPIKEQSARWQTEGFTRLLYKGEVIRISEIHKHKFNSPKDIYLLIDRIITDGARSTANRFADSVQTAFFEGKGECAIQAEYPEESQERTFTVFSERFEADGMHFIEPTEHLFDFNNPMGACPRCKGFGNVIGIDPDLVIPDKSKTIYEGAIACWHGEKMGQWNKELIYNADKFGFPIHTPYQALSHKQKRLLWTGNEYFHGLDDFFTELESKQYQKIQYKVLLARYRGKAVCPECEGKRLRQEAGYVYINGKNITELCEMSIQQLHEWFNRLKLTKAEEQTVHLLLHEINSRLRFMEDVGLGYLTLSRMSNTLSGGEGQRINLAKSLGSSLVGSLYVLDEPSIGLHARDTDRLIHILKELRDLGNTIVVVEHDEDIIRSADYIIEIGPEAGMSGGHVVYEGLPKNTLVPYTLSHSRRAWHNYIEIHGARENNLKDISVRFPLNVLTAVTGVSGSGKSSLVSQVLYPTLSSYYGGTVEHIGQCDRLDGSLHLINGVEYINQNPLSKSSRSNPVIYLKAYEEIRALYASQQLSRQMGFTPSHFSFNTPGGRCEACQGEGTITIEMQFMADIILPCEQCHGKRFKQDILDVQYNGKSIYDILEMTVNEAIDFFSQAPKCNKIIKRLKPLQNVGIGYVKLGQPSSTLSGGEIQRVKLASFLAQEDSKPTMFIFDEPTTGLSRKDIDTLLKAFDSLISKGHSIIVIEHNPRIILAADHVIDLGPEGGDKGGSIVFEGTPEELVNCESSYTGQYLKKTLSS